MRRGRDAAAGLGALALLATAGTALAFDGELDPVFDGPGGAGNGKVVVPITSLEDRAQAVAIQPDGKIVVVGLADKDPGSPFDADFAIVRFNPDGTLDQGFDGDPPSPGNGIVITEVGGSQHDSALAVGLAADGDIIAAGGADMDAGVDDDFDIALARYQGTDGSLDTSFGGGDGIVTTNVGTAADPDDFSEDLVVQPDGKIVVGGEANMAGAGFDFAILRYNDADGTLDTSFDGDSGTGNGIVTTDFDGGDDFGLSVVKQADGKLVLGGEIRPSGQPDDLGLARYGAADGKLDPVFDGNSGTGNGRITVGFGTGADDQAHDLAIGPGGKLIAAGITFRPGIGNDLILTRHNPADGTLDTSFDGESGTGNGKLTASLSPGASGSETVRGLAVMPDGRIITGGYADVDPAMATTNLDFSVARFTSTGRFDDGFSGDGFRTDPIKAALSTDVINDLVLSGQRVIAVGYSGDAPGDPIDRDVALARYVPDTDDPNTRFTRKPRRRTRDRTPTFRFRSDEAASTFMCKLDRRAFKPCRSPKTLRRLRFGVHRFRVKAIDAVGNEDETPVKRRFRVIRP